ncbi:MAG: TonB-dependent receptor [Gemmatimonadota bacterium]
MKRRDILPVLALAALPSALQAQEKPDSAVALEPVVVRVLRSTTGTGSPYAVSVAAGEELTRANPGAFLEETLRSLPGVQIQNRFNLASGERLSIRGFGSRAQFGIRGVQVLVDGIPATLPDGQTSIDHLDPATLGRVEMLRGPGSALYGNAAGGVLHFESRAPAPGGPRFQARTATGSDGLRTYLAGVTGTASGVGYRATLSRFTYDGFRRNPVADDGSTYGRQKRTIVNGIFDFALGEGQLKVVANGLDMAAANPGSLSAQLLSEGDRQAYRFNVIQDTREDARQGQLGVTWTGTLGALDGEVSTWGIRREFEGRIPSDVLGFDRNAGGVRALFHGEHETALGLVSLGGGMEAELQSDDRHEWANEGGAKGDLSLSQQERVRDTGLFAQARLELGHGWSVLGGLRYDRFRFQVDDRFLTDGTDDSGVRVMHAVSPSGGLVWEVAPRVELFGSVGSFFETPTTTELGNRASGAGGFNPDLDPTHGVNYEAGVRARAGRSWSAEATLFRADLRDELVPFEVPSTPGRTYYRNAGRSHHQGWELLVEGSPTDALWTRVAYTRVDGRFDAYATEGGTFDGNRIPGLAPYRVDGSVMLRQGPGYVELRGLYQDAMPVDDANENRSPGYFLADVRAGLDGVSVGGVTLSPFVAVANALDRRYVTAVVVNAFGSRFYEPGPGRTFEMGVAATLGG